MHSNILFVDDDSAVLDALEWTFTDEPYGCFTSKTVDDALNLMDKIDFAVVISDQRMPEMCGIDFLKKVKHQWPATIRILMTAYQEMDIVLNAVNTGHVYNLIFKPWDEGEFKRIIKTAVDDYSYMNGAFISRRYLTETDDLREVNQILEKRNQYLMERLQQAQKMEALGNLSSGIAHDFNNILLGIRGTLQLISQSKSIDPKILRSHLGLALDASDRAQELVSQILSFSSASENIKRPVALGPLVEKVVEFIQVTKPLNVKILQKIGVVGEMTDMEPAKVYQILMNLCSNAFDALKGTQGVIHISLTKIRIEQPEQVEQIKLLPGDYFCLTIGDNGVGIDESTMERIFDPYFTTKQKSGGTGLGLALISQIIHKHGGRISVHSEIGKGTIFTVYLPQIKEDCSFTRG